MAEENTQDEVIIIEEGDDKPAQENETNDDDSKNKKLLIIAAAVIVALLIILVIVLIIFMLQKKSSPSQDFIPFTETLTENKIPKVQPSNVENMIAKANYLYNNGNREKALKLYKKISNFNESLSKYNLGVAQLSNKQYKTARESFKSAIKNGEHICVSAINAAVCSLNLNDKEHFNYYIDLAQSYLPQENDAKLYSYYFTLIKFYKENYYDALSSLKYRTSQEYTKEQNELEGKIFALYHQYPQAIDKLETPFNDMNVLTLGLLYANIGEFTIAQKYINEAILQGKDPSREQLSLALLQLKSEQIGDASSLLRNLTAMYPNDIYNIYPIYVYLKDSLFNTKLVQKNYREKLLRETRTRFQKVFYFSPYKAFDADRTISYIRKGNANIYIDDVQSAQSYLKKSANTSGINYLIVQAIQKAISHNLRDANTLLLQAREKFPKHSILNYNLALTYAQLGDIENAYKYFLDSYYQDASNYLSGIYAVMCEKILKINNPKLLAIIKHNLADENDDEKFQLYRTLAFYMDNNFVAAGRWLNTSYQERPLYVALKVLISQGIGRDNSAQYYSEKLTFLLPSDILTHLMYIDTHFNTNSDVTYVKNALAYLRKQNLTYNDLYFGADITRKLYIQMALITGKLFPLVEQLQNKLDVTLKGQEDIIRTLALASIYNKNFENAYVLYNQLIDEYKIRDSQTLFLGAVASIAANHHANAIALLELAKIRNTKNFESRYALGLLYMESENNDGASIQFSKIGHGFSSKFFDFKIDTNKLMKHDAMKKK